MRIALVYDRVNHQWGGAERVLEALHEIWPQAPLYTSVYHPAGAPWAKKIQVMTSFLQKIPLARRHHELFPWLMPLAFESFKFDNYDVVISVTSEFAKGIITKPETLHLCYCLTPTRYLWSHYDDYFPPSLLRLASWPVVKYLRQWDRIAAQRPDEYFAISQTVQKRIKKYYGRESEVVYPGINVQKFKSLKVQNSNYFLVVSRLVESKRVDLVIQAFNKLGWGLKIIGTGRQEKRLKRMAGPTVEFLGQLTDRELISYYQNCRALIAAQEEDFGLAILEVQAAGKPVIAYQGGGVTETAMAAKTGVFFQEQTVEALIKSLKKFPSLKFKESDCQRQAAKFRLEIFKKKFKDLVENQWRKHVG